MCDQKDHTEAPDPWHAMMFVCPCCGGTGRCLKADFVNGAWIGRDVGACLECAGSGRVRSKRYHD